MLGHGDIELEDVDRLWKFARDSLGQAQRATRAGQHDAGTFLLRELGDAESQ